MAQHDAPPAPRARPLDCRGDRRYRRATVRWRVALLIVSVAIALLAQWYAIVLTAPHDPPAPPAPARAGR
jgi:hypothetical protein